MERGWPTYWSQGSQTPTQSATKLVVRIALEMSFDGSQIRLEVGLVRRVALEEAERVMEYLLLNVALEISERDDAAAQELAVARVVTHLVDSVYAMHQVVGGDKDHAIYNINDEHGSDREGDDSEANDMDLFVDKGYGDGEESQDDGDNDGDDDSDGPETDLVQTRLSQIVGLGRRPEPRSFRRHLCKARPTAICYAKCKSSPNARRKIV